MHHTSPTLAQALLSDRLWVGLPYVIKVDTTFVLTPRAFQAYEKVVLKGWTTCTHENEAWEGRA